MDLFGSVNSLPRHEMGISIPRSFTLSKIERQDGNTFSFLIAHKIYLNKTFFYLFTDFPNFTFLPWIFGRFGFASHGGIT